MRTSRATQPKEANGRLYYRPREVAALTGIGLRTIYGLVAAARIPSRKIGDARLIPASWLVAATDAEADDIQQSLAFQQRRYSPKNRYSLGKSPRDPRRLLRLLRIGFSQQMRMNAAA